MAKKNNTAEKAILDAQNITKALKESTHNSLRDILSEAIDQMINEPDEEENDAENEDGYDVEDVDTEETPATDDAPENEGDEESTDSDTDGDAEGGDDEWSDMEQYKVDDNEYDFTGVDGDEILKVYNKLGDDDKIFVKQEGDGTFEVNDEETGAEYVIELNADALNGDSEESEFGSEEMGGDFGDEGDSEIEIEMDNEGEGEDEGETEYEFDFGDESDEDEDDLLNEENLGYTETYQKDVMPGLKMNEPADSKTTYSMDDGAPDGNSRPYSGYENKDSNLFTKSVNEDAVPADGSTPSVPNTNMEEAGYARRKATMTTSGNISNDAHTEYMSKGSHNVHAGGKTGETINETVKKIVNKAKAIQAENKQYLNALNVIKTQLKEAAVLNVTLAQVVKLLSEETTSKSEKKSIIERFENVKTIAESKALYNTIKRELNENKSTAKVLEEQISANPSNMLNETTIYNKANNPSLNLMERMNNLYK